MLIENANNRPVISLTVWMNSLLIFSWLFGLLLGYIIYKPLLFLQMRSVIYQPVSIVGLLVCIFLPLLLSKLFVLVEKPILISVVCFIKAVSYGFSSALISHEFTTASWLVRHLFLFSDSCFLLVLLMLWFSCMRTSAGKRLRNFRIAAALGIVIAATDFFLVSPFLERLI